MNETLNMEFSIWNPNVPIQMSFETVDDPSIDKLSAKIIIGRLPSTYVFFEKKISFILSEIDTGKKEHP